LAKLEGVEEDTVYKYSPIHLELTAPADARVDIDA